MSKTRYALIATLLLTLALPSIASGQRDRRGRRPTRARDYEPPRDDRADRQGFGFSFNYGQPTGEFRNYVDQGFGADGFYRFALDRYGVVSLRVGGQFLIYGHERQRLPLSSTIGNLVMVNVNTSNNIVGFGGGLELAAPTPAVRPYIFGQLGTSYFYTQTSVEGSNSQELDFARTTNYHDWVFARQLGGGLQIPLGRARRGTSVQLDLGATYSYHGPTRYLNENSIVKVGQGQYEFHPITSDANLVTYRLGVAFSLR